MRRMTAKVTPIGGLNLSREPNLVDVNEFTHLLNYDTRERGRLKGRGGCAKVLTSALTANTITSLIPYDFYVNLGGAYDGWARGVIVSDGETLWAVSNGSYRIINKSFGFWEPFAGVVGSAWRGVVYNARLYLTNGLNAPLVWDGGAVARLMGILRPTFTPTETHVSGTTLTTTHGGYQYRFTYYNSTTGLESSEGEHAIAQTGNFTAKDVTIAGMGTDKTVKIYRTEDGGTTFYYLATVVTTDTYVDQTTDAVLLTHAAMEVNDQNHMLHDPPPASALIEVWNDRMWFGGKAEGTTDLDGYWQPELGEVYYSLAQDPEYVPYTYLDADESNWISVKEVSSDIKAMRAFRGRLMIGTRDRIYRVEQNGEGQFLLDQIDTTVGAMGYDASVSIGPSLVFFGSYPIGLYEFDGVRITNLAAAKMHDAWNPPYGDSSSFESSGYSVCSVAYNQVANQIWLTQRNVITTAYNDRIAVLQLGVEARWTLFDIQAVKVACARGLQAATDVYQMCFIDRFGYLWVCDAAARDGVPSGTSSGTATGAGATTLTQSTAAFYATGGGLAGCHVRITGGTGIGQVRYISSNTATQLTVESAWTTTPDTTSTYQIGEVDLELKTSALRFAGQWTSGTEDKKFKAALVEVV
jgi:hypothetical protein